MSRKRRRTDSVRCQKILGREEDRAHLPSGPSSLKAGRLGLLSTSLPSKENSFKLASISINLGSASATSTSTHKYSVILPTYNERRNLPIIIWLLNETFTKQQVFVPQWRPARELNRSHRSELQWEVIVVDDASPDGTLEVAKQLQAVYGADKIVRCSPLDTLLAAHERATDPETASGQVGAGVGQSGGLRWGLPEDWGADASAVSRTAYIHGLQFCTGDFVVIMDADFSHHVRRDPALVPFVPAANLFADLSQPKFLIQFIQCVQRIPSEERGAS